MKRILDHTVTVPLRSYIKLDASDIFSGSEVASCKEPHNLSPQTEHICNQTKNRTTKLLNELCFKILS